MDDNYNLQKLILRKNPNIIILKSPIHRWGVFATDKIEKYDILEESPYFTIPIDEIQHSPTCNKYTYSFSDELVIMGLGFAGIYNHSSNPNADYEIDKVNEVIRHYATKDIDTGNEITIDYGENNVDFYNLSE